MARTVNLAGLTRAAVTYNNVLRELPYFTFNEAAKALRLNIQKVKGEDKEISVRRKAGILRPYMAGLTPVRQAELLKFFEQSLKPVLVYSSLVDNITQYKEKNVVSNQGEFVDNKAKKHPLEAEILKAKVRSFAEDVTFVMFFAERDDDGNSPMDAFTGFFPKMDLLTVAGEISAAKNNLRPTGSFDSPTDYGRGADGMNHFLRLVEFVKSGHPLLRKGEVILQCAELPLAAARDGLRVLVSSHDYPSIDQMLEKLRSDANCPNLKITTHECLGTGDKLTLSKPGLFDFGVGAESDPEFVQVRAPFEDPNEIQFWIQAEYDTRIKDVHEKVFQTNERTNNRLDLAGDYR